jgi:hypothetical protein
MFKFTSQKISLALPLFLQLALQLALPLLVCFAFVRAEAKTQYKSFATVDFVADDQNLIAVSDTSSWNIGEILPIISQNSKIGVFAYGELTNVKSIQGNKYQLKLKLLRQSRKYLIQQGDYVKRLNLEFENSDYVGTTDLLVKKSDLAVSSKYRPFVYQGIFIGETAQSLYKDEVLINFLGNAFYGLTEDIMVGSYLPLNILTGLNGSAKFKFYDSESTTLSAGLNYSEIRNKSDATLNLNLYWDSVSSDTLISHIYLSLGLIKWEGAGDAAAIKTLGSSSFQTGYEVVMSNWDRFLIGPSYNFDTKALGGYLSYVWIYDRFHAQVSLNTTNIVSLKASLRDGYYMFFDLYWRF